MAAIQVPLEILYFGSAHLIRNFCPFRSMSNCSLRHCAITLRWALLERVRSVGNSSAVGFCKVVYLKFSVAKKYQQNHLGQKILLFTGRVHKQLRISEFDKNGLSTACCAATDVWKSSSNIRAGCCSSTEVTLKPFYFVRANLLK